MIGSLKIKIHSGVIGTFKMVKPIIIAGGIGTRLWPMSSKVLPKQFMKVNSQKSLFQETLSRIASKKFEKPIIVTNIEYKELINIQLAEEDVEADILFEEIQKNSLPKPISRDQSHFKCNRLCHFYKNNWPGTDKNMCIYIQNHLHEHGMEKTVRDCSREGFDIGFYEAPG